MERRLAAILAADVAGYTALMGADEYGTLRRLTDLRRDFLDPLIDGHHGRIVKLIGDGLMVEFANVDDAMACALTWQDGVAEREAGREQTAFSWAYSNSPIQKISGGDVDVISSAAKRTGRFCGVAGPGQSGILVHFEVRADAVSPYLTAAEGAEPGCLRLQRRP